LAFGVHGAVAGNLPRFIEAALIEIKQMQPKEQGWQISVFTHSCRDITQRDSCGHGFASKKHQYVAD
jgi:hypothetical protein